MVKFNCQRVSESRKFIQVYHLPRCVFFVFFPVNFLYPMYWYVLLDVSKSISVNRISGWFHPKIPSLKLTAKAPENRPFTQKESSSYSKHPFSGAKMLVDPGVYHLICRKVKFTQWSQKPIDFTLPSNGRTTSPCHVNLVGTALDWQRKTTTGSIVGTKRIHQQKLNFLDR